MADNPNRMSAILNLARAEGSTFPADEDFALAQAAVHAQLAVAYELNTIARILALAGDIVQPIEGPGADYAAGVMGNAILERLGL